MVGSVVSYGDRRAEQCVLFSGTCSPVRKVWRTAYAGNLGATLGMGKDKGMESF